MSGRIFINYKNHFKDELYNNPSLLLNKDEWFDMILTFIDKINSIEIGRIFWNRIETFISNGYNIEITTNDDISSYIYPKIRFVDPKKVLIVIPSIPYFIECDCVNIKVLNNITIRNHLLDNLKLIGNYESAKFPIDLSDILAFKINGLIIKEIQSYFMIFINLLIYCLRHFEKIKPVNQNNLTKATIYGLSVDTLIIDNIQFTENTFRKAFNKPPRISSDTKEIYIADVPKTFNNKYRFNKNDFYKL